LRRGVDKSIAGCAEEGLPLAHGLTLVLVRPGWGGTAKDGAPER